MNLVLDNNTYNINNVFFYDPVKNTVMDDSKFIRIIYSDENIILNGLYLKILLKDNDIVNSLEFVDSIENNILYKYNNNKVKINKLKDQLQYVIKKNAVNNMCILKISGIWETDNLIGLTYKYISEII